MKQWIAKQYNKIIGNWWTIKRCGFPYNSGYATFNSYKNMILDTGLTKRQAIETCKELNHEKI